MNVTGTLEDFWTKNLLEYWESDFEKQIEMSSKKRFVGIWMSLLFHRELQKKNPMFLVGNDSFY